MSKQSWESKEVKVRKKYPNALNVDWSTVFSRDPDTFTKLLSEVIKSEGRGSKPGKRPQLDRSEAEIKLAKISGEDFSDRDFHSTFVTLCGDRSMMNVANKTGLSKSYVQKLLNKSSQPSIEALESIARGFGREPNYFKEYRVAHIMGMIESFLDDSPESTIIWYMKLKGNDKLRLS